MVPFLHERSGVQTFWGVPEYTILERATAQPTLDVNGLYGGYQGEGGKTIIPARAGFKVSMRLVADQDPRDIGQKFTRFVEGFATDTLKIEVQVQSYSRAAQLLTEGPAIEAIQRAFTETWGKPTILYRNGGSIPIIGMFQHELGVPITNLGYGVGDNGHAPNEYYELEFFGRNIETAIHFFYHFAELSR
jgi:acetylornithine deacetylase/succinyl-diaminopimelate desuccinylase-like protein